jgi:hypothetical protein
MIIDFWCINLLYVGLFQENILKIFSTQVLVTSESVNLRRWVHVSYWSSIGCCDVPGFQRFSIVSLIGKLLYKAILKARNLYYSKIWILNKRRKAGKIWNE